MTQILTLHDYQKNLLKYITVNKNVGLFLEPGLGKTIITLAYIAQQLVLNPNYKVLVIAPLRVIYSTWPDEISNWSCFSQISWNIFHKVGKLTNPRFGPCVNLINPEGLPKFFKYFPKTKIDLLIVDESTLFKSASTKRFKLLKKHLNNFSKKIILTGTPVPNGYLGLWSQIYILDEGKALETAFTRYKHMYFRQVDYQGYVWKIKQGYDKIIQQKIKHLCTSLKIDTLKNLPPRINRIQYNLLDNPTFSQYTKLKKHFIIELEKETLVAPNILVKLLKCQQFSNGCIYDENKQCIEIHQEKIKSLIHLLENLHGKNVLLLYNFNSDLHIIKKYIDICAILNGQTKPTNTKGIIERWNNGDISILCAQPQAMAHGLNLQTGGHHIIWFGLTYSLEIYQQANARLYRQNQKNTVIVHHLLTKETIDQQIYNVLNNKNINQQNFIEVLRQSFY